MRTTKTTLAVGLAAARAEIKEMEAQTISRLLAAYNNIQNAGKSRMMASGVIVSIHALGGREIVPPFVVADGLADDTIAALRRDVLTTQHDTIARNTIKVKP